MQKKYTSEEIVNSLEGVQRAEPSPFLFTRVMTRLEREQSRPELAVYRLIARPVFAVAIASLLIIVNGYLIMNRTTISPATNELSQVVAVEYAQQNHSNPYETNEQP
ncbi:MAG: hypothetical protein ACKO03_00160 [Bacteroidota bacterium]